MTDKEKQLSRSTKVALWSSLIVLIFLFCGIAAIPHLLSTSSGKNWALNSINNRIKGTLTLEHLSLSWWGKQQVSEFSLKDSEGKEVASFKSFSTDTSLFSLFFGTIFHSYHLGTTTLDHPQLHLVRDGANTLNLDNALSKKGKNLSHKKKSGLTFPKIKGDISVTQGTITLVTPKTQPIYLTDLSVELKKASNAFQIYGKTKQGEVKGEILASGQLEPPAQLVISLQDLPLALLDQWTGTPLFTKAFGNTLSLDAELVKTNQTTSLSGAIQAANLKGSFSGSTHGKRFVLQPGGQATWTITPAFFKHIIEKSAEEKWSLAGKSDLILTIQQLDLPLDLDRDVDWKEILFSGQLYLERAEIAHEQLGHFSVNQFTGYLKSSEALEISYEGKIQSSVATQIQGEGFLDNEGKFTYTADWREFPVDLFQLVSDEAILLKDLVGPSMNFGLQGTYDHGKIHALISLESIRAALKGHIEGKTPELSIDLEGDLFYSQKYRSFFGPDPHLSLQAFASVERKTFAIPAINATLENPYWKATIEGKLGQRGESFHFNQVHLEALATVKNLPIQEHDVVVTSGKITVQADGAKNVVHARASLETSVPGQKETRSLEAAAEINHLIQNDSIHWKGAEISANGVFNSFPIALLNPLFDNNVNLIAFLGPAVDVRFQGTYSPGKEQKASLDLEARGQDFNANLSVSLDKTLKVSPEKPSFIHWELTPVRYQTLMRLLSPDQEPDYVLTRGTPIDLAIHSFTCPTTLPETAMGFICQSGFSGDFKVGPLHFKSRKTSQEISLLDINGSLHGENFSQAIQLSTQGKLVSPTIPKGQEAGFSFDGQMLGFWSSDGIFNPHGTVKGNLQLDLVPVKEFTGILPLNDEHRQMIQALLGPLVNARVYGEISDLTGPLTIDIKSSNLKAILPLNLSQGVMTLQRNVEAELTFTEAINAYFFKDVNPMMITGAWSEHPIRILIEAQGFSFPIHPYNFRGIHIENALIDLGKIRVRNGGQIQALMNFLQAKEVSSTGEMEAWFTPIYLSLKDGVATYRRFDMLLGGNIHIALWGRIDLNKDKVKMTLGISSSTIQERFNVRELSKNDMFQVKMRGSTKKLELDWGAASTRIGIIIAKNAAGGLGAIVGGIIEQIIGNLGEEPTPAPTTPIPWDR